LTVTADASGSSDTDQTPIAQFAFDFGDGTAVTVQSGARSTHTYIAPGTYAVSVAVIDTARLSVTVSASVTVS
jgi:PKD repeat protein